MKTLVLFFAAIITFNSSNAQFSQNFDGTELSLTSNCWTLSGVNSTTDASEVITGTASMITIPTATDVATRDIITPALIIPSSFMVSFNYKISSPLNGQATRSIEIGLLDVAGSFTSLRTITLDKKTPTTSINYSETFSTDYSGSKRLVIKLGGVSGDGSSRLIFDDLSTNATAKYGTGTCNSAPVAVNDVFSGVQGGVVTGNVITNDNEPNGETMIVSIIKTSNDGVVVLNTDGSFTFTPNANFKGSTTTFTYSLSDNGYSPLTSNVATVTINFIAAATLPINLINFDAKYNKPDAILNWSTAQEKNFSHFVLEQSTDGIIYNQLAVVFGAGESDTKKNYSYTDKNLTGRKGLVYYRLKSVDNDGKYDYSSVRIIRLDEEKKGITLSTYPNPAVNELKVTIPAAWQSKKATYEVVNINGQVAKRVTTANSSQTETININNLAPGFYIVKVICEGEIAQQKIVKQ
ncbi:MAG: T9SS type A sorting domain-containing protein [Chitinophagaceae bacterium]